jgi:hypothetical protein
MTVAVQTPYTQATGNGVTVTFPFAFLVADQADLKVTVNGVLLANLAGYTVSGIGNQSGGSVSFTSAPASGATILMERSVELKRTTDYQYAGDLPSRTLNFDFDRVWLALQGFWARVLGGIRAPYPEQMQELPNAATRAGRLLGFNSSGNPVPVLPNEQSASALSLLLASSAGASALGYDDLTQQDINDSVRPIASYAALRAYSGRATSVRVTTNGIAGYFYRDTLDNTSADNGGTVIVDASNRRWKRLFSGLPDVRWFGVLGNGTDETAKLTAALTAHNGFLIPDGLTVTAKNIQLPADFATIQSDGALKLPSGCADFDRLIHANNRRFLSITVRELDGNYAGQAGVLGTHLVYLTNCADARVNVKYAHDHYANAGAAQPSVDGMRTTSTGAIWLYRCARAELVVGYVENWAREGIQTLECDDSTVSVGHCQAHPTRNTEYSGVQMQGKRSKLLRASVDFAGASGVGFDVSYGEISNVISTRTRENHGINFGHAGYPASYSSGTNLIAAESWDHGICVLSGTVGLKINGFNVSASGDSGVNSSDNSDQLILSNGISRLSGKFNVQAFIADVLTSNVEVEEVAPVCLYLTTLSGQFAAGEVVSSGGNSGTVLNALRNLNATQQRLILGNVVGTFSVGNTVTGATSGAVGTVTTASVPLPFSATGGGAVVGVNQAVAEGRYVERPNGEAVLTLQKLFTVPASTPGWSSTFTFPAQCRFAATPIAFGSVYLAVDTNNYALRNFAVAALSPASGRLTMEADFAQNYGVTFEFRGRWK